MSEISQFQPSDLDGFSAKQTQEFLDKLLQQQVTVAVTCYISCSTNVVPTVV